MNFFALVGLHNYHTQASFLCFLFVLEVDKGVKAESYLRTYIMHIWGLSCRYSLKYKTKKTLIYLVDQQTTTIQNGINPPFSPTGDYVLEFPLAEFTRNSFFREHNVPLQSHPDRSSSHKFGPHNLIYTSKNYANLGGICRKYRTIVKFYIKPAKVRMASGYINVHCVFPCEFGAKGTIQRSLASQN